MGMAEDVPGVGRINQKRVGESMVVSSSVVKARPDRLIELVRLGTNHLSSPVTI